MAKPKGPGLADFAVHLHGHHPLKIRATSILVVDKWLYLRDAAGGVLFAAPEMNLHYVRHLEPGEELAAPERLPESVFAPYAHLNPVPVDVPEVVQVDEPESDPLFMGTIEPVAADPSPSPGVAVDARGRKHGPGGRFAKA